MMSAFHLEHMDEDEVRVDLPEALILDGSADGVGQFPLCRAGLEIKTMSEKEFGTLRKPKPEHIVQASALYSKGLDVPFMSGWSPDGSHRRPPTDASRSQEAQALVERGRVVCRHQ